jgi:hypothetical protein
MRCVAILFALLGCGRTAATTRRDPGVDIQLADTNSDARSCVKLVVGETREPAVLCNEAADSYWESRARSFELYDTARA